MVSKEITYQNVDGKTVTEVAYFHLNKGDLMEIEVEFDEGFDVHAKKVVEKQNKKEILNLFKYLISKAYGVRTEEGGFYHDEAKTRKFMQSEAYGELLFSLASNEAEIKSFMEGIMPKLPTGAIPQAAK